MELGIRDILGFYTQKGKECLFTFASPLLQTLQNIKKADSHK